MLPNTFTGVISAASHILWQNFLDIQDGAFYTSPHKKEVLINLADNDVIFEGVKYKDILDSDEIFITQTTSGILPVVEIDGQRIGSGKPGPVTKKLMGKFKKLVWGK